MVFNRAMDPIYAEYDDLMLAVDADLEADDPDSALARLEEFIQKHVRPEDDLEMLRALIETNGCIF